jgi:predicted acyltransferase
LVLAGLLFQWAGICPIVKRIWTSSYTLYSGGLVILMLAGFYALIDWKGWQRWAFPLIVVGMNSIAIYVMSWTMADFFRTALQTHLGALISALVWPTLLPIAYGIGVIMTFWLILFWMYRRNIFLRI